MSQYEFSNGLVDRLPKVRGRLTENSDLSKVTWFRVGGPAEVVFKPADMNDLSFFLKEKSRDIPLTSLGVGSNILVRDGGVPGVVLRLGKGFNNIILGDKTVDVGAAVLDRSVAMLAKDEGLEGLEFLCGIPGTIGGALRMNAGCYGTEIKDILDAAFAYDSKGNLQCLTAEDMGYSYRHCDIPSDWVFVGARFKFKRGDKEQVSKRISEMLEQREGSQPVKSRTGGSTFANPEGHKAWQLIDQAGCRGLKRGGAMVSEMHCNFLINTGDATAKDLEDLAEEVHKRVKMSSGIDLRWEIQRLGLQEGRRFCTERAA